MVRAHLHCPVHCTCVVYTPDTEVHVGICLGLPGLSWDVLGYPMSLTSYPGSFWERERACTHCVRMRLIKNLKARFLVERIIDDVEESSVHQ